MKSHTSGFIAWAWVLIFVYYFWTIITIIVTGAQTFFRGHRVPWINRCNSWLARVTSRTLYEHEEWCGNPHEPSEELDEIADAFEQYAKEDEEQ